MAFPTGTLTDTNLDKLISEVWSTSVNDFFRANLVCANFFENWSDDLMNGGDIIHKPGITQMTAYSKTVATGLTLSANTEDSTDLTVDTWNYVAFAIEDREKAQVVQSYRLQDVYAKNAGYTAAATLEDAIIALFDNFANNSGASDRNIADSDILAAIASLDTNNVPQEDRAFFFHPAVFWKQIYALDKFTSRDFSNALPVQNGFQGILYGIPVYITSRLPVMGGSTDGRVGALAHKSAIAWAALNLGGVKADSAGVPVPQYVRVQKQYVLEYLSTLVVADICYGVIENRDTSGFYLKCKY